MSEQPMSIESVIEDALHTWSNMLQSTYTEAEYVVIYLSRHGYDVVKRDV